ncbi:MAG: hypothetical protein WCF50_20900, partial [Pseudolabrys sp.]
PSIALRYLFGRPTRSLVTTARVPFSSIGFTTNSNAMSSLSGWPEQAGANFLILGHLGLEGISQRS